VTELRLTLVKLILLDLIRVAMLLLGLCRRLCSVRSVSVTRDGERYVTTYYDEIATG
jgi:hypothetical protein